MTGEKLALVLWPMRNKQFLHCTYWLWKVLNAGLGVSAYRLEMALCIAYRQKYTHPSRHLSDAVYVVLM
jgi:hypothetical protein